MKKAFLIPFIIAIILIYSPAARTAWIWTPETGRWLNPRHSVKDTAPEQLDHAMSFYESKDYKRAVSELDKLVRFYPNSRHAAKAQYYIGRSYEEMEEYYHSYLAYQKVIEAYPHSEERDEIIRRQYEIGTLFLKGEKAKVLGVALLPATDKAIEIFGQVVKNSPYGPYGDKAQFKIGESYKKSGRFAEATMAFQKLVDDYPRSALLREANYQIAQCAYLASLDYSYDQETTDSAIERFEELAAQGAIDTFTKEAKDSLKVLREKKARSLYDTALFYEKTGHRDSAVVYYKELIERYPDSSLAGESLSRAMEIEKGKR